MSGQPKSVDACRPVALPGGQVIRVRAERAPTPAEAEAIGELAAAARRRAAQRPVDAGAAELYQRLEAARVARGLMWRQIGHEAGVSPAVLSRLAQGRMPGGEELVALESWLAEQEVAGP
jgi:hypothetical protein